MGKYWKRLIRCGFNYSWDGAWKVKAEEDHTCSLSHVVFLMCTYWLFLFFSSSEVRNWESFMIKQLTFFNCMRKEFLLCIVSIVRSALTAVVVEGMIENPLVLLVLVLTD